MTTGILIIAHAPLASALREAVLHVFPEHAATVSAVDIRAEWSQEQSLAVGRAAMDGLKHPQKLVLTDMKGATPCNVGQSLAQDPHVKMICGVNFPMLLRAVTYRDEPLHQLVERAMLGGVRGIELVAPEVSVAQVVTAPPTFHAKAA
jgi:mannose PTS system EIIA component